MANRHKIGQRKMRQAEFRGLAAHHAPSKANAAPSIVPPAMSLAQWTPSMMREKPLRTIIAAASAQAKNRQRGGARSEEHTSELQSLMRISYAVFCLKKKKATTH